MSSQPETIRLTEADEIQALLPWLVSGTLSAAETARVERYLSSQPEAAAHVARVRDEQHFSISANESIAAPSPACLDRLMASIAETSRPMQFAVPSPASVWEALASYVTRLSPRALGIATAAAALVLVAQAITIGTLVPRDTATFQTASGDATTPVGEGVELLVSLQPGASASAFTAALVESKAVVVGGPKAGLYRVRIGSGKPSAEVSAKVLEQLKVRSDVFAFVGRVSAKP